MPDISKQVTTLLNLQPGDIVISEAPYEDTMDESEFKPVTHKNLDKFEATHISIYTGNYIKPFAHSVREGFKLPGVRLTGAWEGRHIIFRFKDPDFSARVAEIARRWAISSTMYDQSKFDRVYPERFWNEQYGIYKHQFFSIPNATVSGPAIPYNMRRTSQQLCDRGRNNSLKNFRSESMLRAVKFASRSELFQCVSKGLRCTSFVVAVVQAAALAPVVHKFNTKFSFKTFKGESFEKLSKKLLISGWKDTPIGINLQAALNKLDFTNFFPEGFVVDSKYAIPKDIFLALRKANDWSIVGGFGSFKDQLLYCNTMEQKSSEMLFSRIKVTNIKSSKAFLKSKYKPGIKHKTKTELLESFSRALEQDNQLKEQLQQEQDTKATIVCLGTPPRLSGPGSPRAINNLGEQKFSRKLDFI